MSAREEGYTFRELCVRTTSQSAQIQRETGEAQAGRQPVEYSVELIDSERHDGGATAVLAVLLCK